jgi:tryptophan synthase alpha chain
MNRIEKKFQELKRQKRKAFITFITAGDPDLQTTEDLVVAFEKAGVDIIELGIPFSDPLADGPTIQASFYRALKKGTTVKKIMETVRRIRLKTSIPIAFMTSYNPILRFGEEKFVKACAEVGVDGLIVPDLPPEEAKNLRNAAQRYDIATIFFVAPTSEDERIKANAKASSGFVYYVSLTGITGTQKAIAQSVVKQIKHIKRFTQKPVCAGFGISTPQQVKDISRAADGVIVGSAIVKVIEQNKGSHNLVPAISRYVHSLVNACKT